MFKPFQFIQVNRVCLASLLSLSLCPDPSRAGQTDIDRFLTEYPAAARKLARDFSQMRGRAEVHLEFGEGKDRWEHVTFANSGGFRKTEIATLTGRDGPTLRESVLVNGPDNSFHLVRKQSETTFTIRGIAGADPQKFDNLDVFGRLLDAPIGCPGSTFAEFLQRAPAEEITAELVTDQGRECVEVVLPTPPVERPGKVTVLFDPALGWAARRCKAEVAGRPSPVLEFEIRYDEERAPYPSQVDFKETGGTWHATFHSVSTEPTDPDEFTLDHYGLAPVKFPESGRPKRWLWYLLAGIGVIAVVAAILIRRISA
jgi:hypothetical protein